GGRSVAGGGRARRHDRQRGGAAAGGPPDHRHAERSAVLAGLRAVRGLRRDPVAVCGRHGRAARAPHLPGLPAVREEGGEMAASFSLLALIGLNAAAAAFGSARADPTQEFGPLWNVVIALDVLNTVIVL